MRSGDDSANREARSECGESILGLFKISGVPVHSAHLTFPSIGTYGLVVSRHWKICKNLVVPQRKICNEFFVDIL
jgi:hypothetical protein